MKRLGVLVLSMMLLLTGCVRPSSTQTTELSSPNAGAQSGGPGGPGQAAAEGPRSAALFPSSDLTLGFTISDAKTSQVTEYLVRDGERVIAGYDGKAYATWFVRESGIWRMDPQHGGALLRYLPPVMQSGLAWKQTSGDAEVWFRLDEGGERCKSISGDLYTQACWALTVLNQGERTQFLFTEGTGPVYARAENWMNLALSFDKKSHRAYPPQWQTGQRSAYLAQGVTGPLQEGAVVPVTADAFQNAVRNAFGGWRNLTIFPDPGEGEVAFLMGAVVTTWTDQPYLLYDRDLQLIRAAWPDRWGKHRITPLRLPGQAGTWLLHEQQLKDENHSQITMLSPRGATVWGFAPKSDRTYGTQVEVDQAGMITIRWDFGDPARHTWIREYQMDNSKPEWPTLNRLSARVVPQEQSLRAPVSEAEVLEAAFMAFWYDLTEELPRYFASPEVAKVLTGNPSIGKPTYGPGTVELGSLAFREITTADGGKTLIPRIEPGPVGPDATADFAAEFGGYEGGYFVWGKVTFGRDPAGRLVIANLVVDEAKFVY